MDTTERAPLAHRLIRRTAIAAACAIAASGLAFAAGTPTHGAAVTVSEKDQHVIDQWQQAHPGVDVTVAAGVSPTSLFHLDSAGTVSMVGDDHILITDPSEQTTWPLPYVLAHEHHHVQQLDLVEQTVGTTPAAWNPVGTAAYYGTIAALAIDLDRVYGTDGIERSADCHALFADGALSGKHGGAYTSACSPQELAAALAVADGTWPTAQAVSERLSAAQELLGNPKRTNQEG